MIVHFDSAAELLRTYRSNNCQRKVSYVGNSWYNNETEADTLRMTETGNTRLVPEAELLLAQLDSVIETPRLAWERAPAGAFCCVPDVLAGLPTPMRRQVHTNDERAPITILIDTGSSGGISAETLKKRGIVALALVMALSRVRPTTLYQLDVGSGPGDGTGETVLTTKINTSPLDLATACYLLTSAGFARGLVYTLEERLNGNSGGWPKDYNYHGGPNVYYEKLKLRLGFDPIKTLIIPASRLNDALLKDSLKWIEKQIRHFTEEEEEVT